MGFLFKTDTSVSQKQTPLKGGHLSAFIPLKGGHLSITDTYVRWTPLHLDSFLRKMPFLDGNGHPCITDCPFWETHHSRVGTCLKQTPL